MTTRDKILELVKQYYTEEFVAKKTNFQPGERIGYGGRFLRK